MQFQLVCDKLFSFIWIEPPFAFVCGWRYPLLIIAKWANMKKIEEETFAKIIMGKADISEFDTFVENWKNQGGDQILKEINEELNNSPGN